MWLGFKEKILKLNTQAYTYIQRGGGTRGVGRVEAGLRRVRLALAEDVFSLRMMRSTQSWSGGAQS